MPEKTLTPEKALETIKGILANNETSIISVQNTFDAWFKIQPPASPNITILRTDAEKLVSALRVIRDVTNLKLTFQ